MNTPTAQSEILLLVLAERAERQGASFEQSFEIAARVVEFAFTLMPERPATMFLFREVDRLVAEALMGVQ